MYSRIGTRKVFDLMFELGAEEWQLDFPAVYGSALNNWMSDSPKEKTENSGPLLDMIIEHVDSAEVREGKTQLLITLFRLFILHGSCSYWTWCYALICSY